MDSPVYVKPDEGTEIMPKPHIVRDDMMSNMKLLITLPKYPLNTRSSDHARFMAGIEWVIYSPKRPPG